MNEDGKTERISLRISKENKNKIEQVAKKDNRTISNWCESTILEKLNSIKK